MIRCRPSVKTCPRFARGSPAVSSGASSWSGVSFSPKFFVSSSVVKPHSTRSDASKFASSSQSQSPVFLFERIRYSRSSSGVSSRFGTRTSMVSSPRPRTCMIFRRWCPARIFRFRLMAGISTRLNFSRERFRSATCFSFSFLGFPSNGTRSETLRCSVCHVRGVLSMPAIFKRSRHVCKFILRCFYP